MISESDFRTSLQEKGYGQIEVKDLDANMDGAMHTHGFSVMLLVMAGEFTLNRESGATTFQPGESFQLEAGTLHAERTGSSGAKVLIGRR